VPTGKLKRQGVGFIGVGHAKHKALREVNRPQRGKFVCTDGDGGVGSFRREQRAGIVS